jgi:Fe-S-cluster containining protein
MVPKEPEPLTANNKFGLIANPQLYRSEYAQTKVLIQEFIKFEPEMTINQKNWLMELMKMNLITVGGKTRKRTLKVFKDIKLLCKIASTTRCKKCKEQNCCKINYGKKNEDEYCFFYKNGKCSIYNCRPLLCRNYLCSEQYDNHLLAKICKKNNLSLLIYDDTEKEQLIKDSKIQ